MKLGGQYFVDYLKTLKSEDWDLMATSKWTVKDMVAHMVGWEHSDPRFIKKMWETKEKPWWKDTKNYDDFNKKWVEFYKSFSPEELIAEWEKWRREIEIEVDEIGEDNLKQYPELFGWLFKHDEKTSHYYHHYEQIKNAILKI